MIVQDGGTFKRTATTNGGEFAGPCLWCGGQDRFRVWPEQDGGRYWCRNCGKHGDTIQYLRDKRGLTFQDACRFIGRVPGPRASATRPVPAAWEPKEATSPAAAWQESARTFLDRAVAELWSREGGAIREWLKRKKGLGDATIEKASLGYSAADLYEARTAWGLAPALKEDGKERCQWLPSGLVIPHIINGAVNRLRVRRDKPGDGARYICISGSSPSPMTMNLDGAATIIVESELDALLLSQEAGDLVGVVALGSAQAKPDKKTHEILKRASLILVALDADEAGAKASWSFWPATYGAKVKRWSCIHGKDPSEAWTNGLNIRSWVMTGLPQKGCPENKANPTKRLLEKPAIWAARIDGVEFLPFPADWLHRFSEQQLERLAIMTVDGGLSDDEAVYKLQQGDFK